MKTRKHKRGGVLWSNAKKSCNDNEKDWNLVWKHNGYEVYDPSYLYPGKYNIRGKPVKNGLLDKYGKPRTCPSMETIPTPLPNRLHVTPILPDKPILEEKPKITEKEKDKEKSIIDKLLRNLIRFESIPNELKKDEDFVFELLTKNSKFFEYIPIELKKNVDFMAKLVLQNKSYIYNLSDELKNNPEFMLRIVKKDATNLYYGSEEIKDNDAIVTQAILQSGNTLNLASVRLSHDFPMLMMATEKSSKLLTELNYYQKELLSMKDLPYVNNKELPDDSIFNGFHKDMSHFGSVKYTSGVTYYGELDSLYNRTGKGFLTIKNAQIHCIWEENGINNIEKVINNSDVNLTLDEFETLIPFMKNIHLVSVPTQFYSLCGFIQSKSQVEDFFKKMKTYTGTLRLAVICHGELESVPFELPIQQLTRISIVPNGVCNTIHSTEHLKTIKTFFQPDFSEKIKQQFLHILQKNCQYYKYNIDDDKKINNSFNKWFTKCSILTKIPEKTFIKQDKILDKTYEVNGPGFNILLLILFPKNCNG